MGPLALALLLGQSAPLTLPPPALEAPPKPPGWALAPPLELGTRLLPFDPDEPSRGPVLPTPPGPEPLSPHEWRAMRIMRARQHAADSSGFAPGPKSPWRAVALSSEGLLAGLVFPPLLTVGPAYGVAYAGEWTQAIVTSSIRTVALAVIAGEAVSFGTTLGSSGTSASQLSSAASTFDAVMVVGGLIIAVTSAFDIATARDEAARANDRWERSVAGEVP